MLTGDGFGRLFETFERSAFRLETLDAYDVAEEREEITRFLAGADMGPDWHDNPWVRSVTSKGRSLARVHVLRSPLSDYLRYELAAYPGNIAAGESIGIIDRAEHDVPGLPDHDFWLFDDRAAYRMHYTPEGVFTGAEALPAGRLDEYRGYRGLALRHAVPFAAYRERHPMTAADSIGLHSGDYAVGSSPTRSSFAHF